MDETTEQIKEEQPVCMVCGVPSLHTFVFARKTYTFCCQHLNQQLNSGMLNLGNMMRQMFGQ